MNSIYDVIDVIVFFFTYQKRFESEQLIWSEDMSFFFFIILPKDGMIRNIKNKLTMIGMSRTTKRYRMIFIQNIVMAQKKWIFAVFYRLIYNRMRLSTFQGNFLIFSLMIITMYNLVKWHFSRKRKRKFVQSTFQKQHLTSYFVVTNKVSNGFVLSVHLHKWAGVRRIIYEICSIQTSSNTRNIWNILSIVFQNRIRMQQWRLISRLIVCTKVHLSWEYCLSSVFENALVLFNIRIKCWTKLMIFCSPTWGKQQFWILYIEHSSHSVGAFG